MSAALLPPPEHVHDFRYVASAYYRLTDITITFVRCEECGESHHFFGDYPQRCFHCLRCLIDRERNTIYCSQCAPLKLQRHAANGRLFKAQAWEAERELDARKGRRFFMLPDREPEPVQMEFPLR